MAVSDTPLSNWEMSIRTYNCLKRSGIETVGDVMSLTTNQLLGVRNFGRKSYEELRFLFIQYGLMTDKAPIGPFVGAWDDLVEDAEAEVTPIVLAGKYEDAYDVPIEKLGLSVRTYNCLKRGNIIKIGQIMMMKQEDLLSIRNFTRTSYEDLRLQLITHGYMSDLEPKGPFVGPMFGEGDEGGGKFAPVG